MRMTPVMLIVGGLMVFWASVYIMVFLPASTWEEPKSDTWRQWSDDEKAGHDLYVRNGCSYCHSLFVRNNDWNGERIAQRGDYVGQQPAILGTERTGPDLSQAGGIHPDDWHLAHFINPRNTRPMSLMPSWEFLGRENLRKLTAFVQAQGGTDADDRMDNGQKKYGPPAQAAYRAGLAPNIDWLHSKIPAVWRPMPNPYPASDAALARGEKVYQGFCVNCHGLMGDGKGLAAAYLDPPPLNFTTLRGHLVEGKYIGGIFYYQIMNGVTGTAMPLFKGELESARIWDVSNFVAVKYLGYTDANIEPRGIDASYEGSHEKTSLPPRIQTKDAP